MLPASHPKREAEAAAASLIFSSVSFLSRTGRPRTSRGAATRTLRRPPNRLRSGERHLRLGSSYRLAQTCAFGESERSERSFPAWAAGASLCSGTGRLWRLCPLSQPRACAMNPAPKRPDAVLRNFLDEHRLRTKGEGYVFGRSAETPFDARTLAASGDSLERGRGCRPQGCFLARSNTAARLANSKPPPSVFNNDGRP